MALPKHPAVNISRPALDSKSSTATLRARAESPFASYALYAEAFDTPRAVADEKPRILSSRFSSEGLKSNPK